MLVIESYLTFGNLNVLLRFADLILMLLNLLCKFYILGAQVISQVTVLLLLSLQHCLYLRLNLLLYLRADLRIDLKVSKAH